MNSCKTRVFITSAAFIAPDVDVVSFKQSKVGVTWIEDIELGLDSDSPYFPPRRELKSMRKDVAASCMAIGELLHETQLGPDELATTPFYMATDVSQAGLTIEMQELSQFYKTVLDLNQTQRNQKVFDEMHPLFALRSLTNAAQAFAAQIYGFRGHNTTYGNTSHSGYYALQDALRDLRSGRFDRAVVGGSNGGGKLSLMSRAGLESSSQRFRESPSASFLLLETQPVLEPLAEVVLNQQSNSTPTVIAQIPTKKYFEEFNSNTFEYAIFSGGSSQTQFEAESQSIALRWKRLQSLFERYGTFGATSVMANVFEAIRVLKSNEAKVVDCLNCDVYGRESHVQLKGCV